MYTNLNCKTSIFFTLCVVLIPIFRIYSSVIPGVDFSELLLGISFIYALIKARKICINKTAKYLLILALSYLFITLINFFVFEHNLYDFIILFTRWFFYLIILTIGSGYISKKFAFYSFNICALIVCFGLLYENISYYFFSRTVTVRIPFLTIRESLADTGAFVTNTYDSTTLRSASFFSEPAHLSYYLCIAICINIFLTRPKYVLSIIYSVCILLSTSTGGIIFSIFIWLYFLFIYKNSKRNIIRNTIIVLGLVSIFFIFSNTSAYNYSVSKIGLFFDSKGVSSDRTNFDNQFAGFSFAELITGVGFGNAEYYIENVLNRDYVYSSSFSLVLMWVGSFGLVITIILLILMIRNTKAEAKVFLFLFIVTLFTTNMLTSSYIIVFLIWPLMYQKQIDLSYNEGIEVYEYV